MNKKLNRYTTTINFYFNKTNGILLFLIIFLGVLIPSFSGLANNIFWLRLDNIISSPFFNFMFFLSIGLNVIFCSHTFSLNYNVINRYNDYESIIRKNQKDIIIATLTLSVVAFLLAISGAAIFSYGKLMLLKNPQYNLPYFEYILFKFMRMILLACVINSILYKLLILIKEKYASLVILGTNLIFFILQPSEKLITHFYNMPLLYHYYFLTTSYSSFFLEIICTILNFLFLVFINTILFKIVTRKKRDFI